MERERTAYGRCLLLWRRDLDGGDDGAMVGGIIGKHDVGKVRRFADDFGSLDGETRRGKDEVDPIMTVCGVGQLGDRRPSEAAVRDGIGTGGAIGIDEAGFGHGPGGRPVDGQRAFAGLRRYPRSNRGAKAR